MAVQTLPSLVQMATEKECVCTKVCLRIWSLCVAYKGGSYVSMLVSVYMYVCMLDYVSLCI